MEGQQFVCPWTEKRIIRPGSYDLDHLLPLSVYPANELWNLVPTDRRFNQHEKRARLPSEERLKAAEPLLTLAYSNYLSSKDLERAMRDDVRIRFQRLALGEVTAGAVAREAVQFIDQMAGFRNIARF